MTFALLCLLLAEFQTAEMAAAEAELSAAIEIHEVQAHVYRLASTEFAGRRGVGAARASQHIAEAFRQIGLKPAFGDSYFQDVPGLANGRLRNGQDFVGRNVAGILKGSDPTLKDEWIIVSAHFDHLGHRNGQLYPGADDNASGVAMLLEVAERFALQARKPKRTLVFVGFDQEESGLIGSLHFANHPPMAIDKLKTMITADMIGRSLHGLTEEYVFVLGSEFSPELGKLISEVTPEEGLRIGQLSTEIIGARSDYGPFWTKKIPFLCFTTGESDDYHKVTDTAERIDYPKLGRISRQVAAIVERLAEGDSNPVWQPSPDETHMLAEIRTVHFVLERVLEQKDRLRFGPRQVEPVQAAHERLAAILTRGKITADERRWFIQTCQLALIMLRR